jgi:5-methylcytosine-specific restriction endonuclease McrA
VATQTQSRTKVCNKCHKRKPREAFYRRTESKDGLQHRCKECMRKYQSARARRKRYLATLGPSPEDKAEFVNQLHLRRARQQHTDITSEWMIELWRSTTTCPLCQRKLANRPGHERSRNLDHIVPIARGGKHMRSNVRIICRECNLKRPYDGSDIPPVPTDSATRAPSPIVSTTRAPNPIAPSDPVPQEIHG